jgi:hypothetical protein
MQKALLVTGTLLLALIGFSQPTKVDTTDLTFTGTRISPYSQEYDSTGKVTLSGYIDTYYAYYTDTAGPNGFQKFPTSAPRSNQFGINMLQVSAKYQSERLRGVATVFFGDCPQSSWSTHLNLIQEANAGFRIAGKLWLDAGFFRTHIGLESIQPRENITTSFATTTYFEPYFLSGAKLTWQHSEKLTLQLNAFNGFNNFIETNANKALGFSTAYVPNARWSYTFSTIFCDESPDGSPRNQLRNYNNLVVVYKSPRVTVGLEGNFGWQQNTKLADSTATATMCSALLAVKYRFTHHWGIYGRAEFYTDPDEILTGPVQNADHTLTGLDILGFTGGLEYKPIPNAYLRAEYRFLQTKTSERIFYYQSASVNYRNELIVSLGVWF